VGLQSSAGLNLAARGCYRARAWVGHPISSRPGSSAGPRPSESKLGIGNFTDVANDAQVPRTTVYNTELRSWSDYRSGENLRHWRSTSGFEVDFILADHTAIAVAGCELLLLRRAVPHGLEDTHVLLMPRMVDRTLHFDETVEADPVGSDVAVGCDHALLPGIFERDRAC